LTLKQRSVGAWEAISGTQRVSFTAADLYQGQIFINNSAYSFQGKSLEQVHKDISALLSKKTSSVPFSSLLGIQDAHAFWPIIVGVGILAVIAIIYAKNKLYNSREDTVKALSILKGKIEEDHNKCQQAGRANSAGYLNEFFRDAELSIFPRNANLGATEKALRMAVKKSALESSYNDNDCYETVKVYGNKIGLEIPTMTLSELQSRREGTPLGKFNSATDVKTALFNACESYNQMVDCVDSLVEEQVNNQLDNWNLDNDVQDILICRRSGGATSR
jgi:hypothetical protein